jgi:hypothetical protein
MSAGTRSELLLLCTIGWLECLGSKLIQGLLIQVWAARSTKYRECGWGALLSTQDSSWGNKHLPYKLMNKPLTKFFWVTKFWYQREGWPFLKHKMGLSHAELGLWTAIGKGWAESKDGPINLMWISVQIRGSMFRQCFGILNEVQKLWNSESS